MLRSRIESALKNISKKNIEYQHQLKELEVGDTLPQSFSLLIRIVQSRLTHGLSNFRTTDILLQEVFAGLQVYHIFSGLEEYWTYT